MFKPAFDQKHEQGPGHDDRDTDIEEDVELELIDAPVETQTVSSDVEDEVDDIPIVRDDVDSSNPEYHRKINITPPNMRITSEIMTLFEFSEVIGIRATQIEKGSPVFVDLTGLTDPRDMATKELLQRRCPLKIVRKINAHEQEEWSCNEMGFPIAKRSAF